MDLIDPFFGTSFTVCTKKICAFRGSDCEIGLVVLFAFAFVFGFALSRTSHLCRHGRTKIDASLREVNVRGISVVGQGVTLDEEPPLSVFWILSATLE